MLGPWLSNIVKDAVAYPILLGGLVAGCTEAAEHGQPIRQESNNNSVWNLESPRAEVGILQGDARYVIGQVADLYLDASGEIFLLDSRFQHVKRYSPRGLHMQTIGGAGQGPGEFTVPSGLFVSKDRRLFVADRGQATVSVFSVQADTFAFERRLDVEFGPESICSTGDHFFVFTLFSDSLVYRYDLGGQPTGAFGHKADRGHPVVSQLLGPASIWCDPQTSSVIVVSTLTPEVAAYREDGSQAWSVELPVWDHLEIETVDGGGARLFPRDDGIGNFSVGLSAFRVDDSRIAVQAGTSNTELRGTGSYSEIRTFILDVSVPEDIQVSVSNEFPNILATSERIAVAYTVEPFPRLLIFDVPE